MFCSNLTSELWLFILGCLTGMSPVFGQLVYNNSHSSLSDLPADIYKQVEILDLSHNAITSIDAGDLAFSSLSDVNFKTNTIEYFDQDAFVSTGQVAPVKRVNLAFNRLRDVPNLQTIGSTLKVLDLSENQITRFTSDNFNGLVVLESLHLVGNPISWRETTVGLENVGPTLLFLDLTEASDYRSKADLTFLEAYTKLETLYIENIVVYDFPVSTGHSICQTLISLDARLNWLDERDTPSFDCFTRLENLVLYYNEYSEFPAFSSSLRASLKTLDLGLQYMTEIPSSSLNGMVSLSKFSVKENSLTIFPIFPHVMDNLTHLDLSNNSISVITVDDFKALPNLEKLNITNNKITVILDISKLYIRSSLPLTIFAEDNSFVCDCGFDFTLRATDVHNLINSIHVTVSEEPCVSPAEYVPVPYYKIYLPDLCGVTTTEEITTTPETTTEEITTTPETTTEEITTTPETTTEEITTTVEIITTPETITVEITTISTTATAEPTIPVTPKPVVCAPIPLWLNIKTKATDPQLGKKAEYTCQEGLQFEDIIDEEEPDGEPDIVVTKSSRCSDVDGSWTPSFVECLEVLDAKAEAQYWEPEEAENAEFFGLAAIIFIAIEVVILLVMDFTTCYKALKSCKNTPRESDTTTKPTSTPTAQEFDEIPSVSVDPRDILTREIFI